MATQSTLIKQMKYYENFKKMVPRTGLEPARLAALAPEASASTNSATWALQEGASIAGGQPPVNAAVMTIHLPQ